MKPPTTDLTAEFEKLDQAAQAGESILPPDAKDCVYLAVGGLFAGAAPDATYFQQNLDALKEGGLGSAAALALYPELKDKVRAPRPRSAWAMSCHKPGGRRR